MHDSTRPTQLTATLGLTRTRKNPNCTVHTAQVPRVQCEWGLSFTGGTKHTANTDSNGRRKIITGFSGFILASSTITCKQEAVQRHCGCDVPPSPAEPNKKQCKDTVGATSLYHLVWGTKNMTPPPSVENGEFVKGTGSQVEVISTTKVSHEFCDFCLHLCYLSGFTCPTEGEQAMKPLPDGHVMTGQKTIT